MLNIIFLPKKYIRLQVGKFVKSTRTPPHNDDRLDTNSLTSGKSNYHTSAYLYDDKNLCNK